MPEDADVSPEALADRAAALHDKAQEALGRLMVDQEEAVRRLVTALLAGGHVLLEDVPGTGKTRLARSLAAVTGGEFRRIQATPDLLPADVTGSMVYRADEEAFRFEPGPVWANVVLVDEINRATPRTQAALLEAMEERQVSAGRETRRLPEPFFVIATQNPIEYEGTFPLPEAQLDRFLLKFSLGYPDAAGERLVMERFSQVAPGEDPAAGLSPVTDSDELRELQQHLHRIHVSDDVGGYMVEMVRRTREDGHTRLGASPRAAVLLNRAARAWAATVGRPFVAPDDVKAVALPVLTHRLVLSSSAQLADITAREVLQDLLGEVAVPAETGVSAAADGGS